MGQRSETRRLSKNSILDGVGDYLERRCHDDSQAQPEDLPCVEYEHKKANTGR